MSSGNERASFTIELRDETSAPAQDAAGALEALKKKIQADTAALREMQAALRAMKGATGAAGDAAKALKDRIDAQKAGLAAAQAQYVRLGGAFGRASPGARSLLGHLGELGDQIRGLPGPLGALGGRLSALASPAALAAGAIALLIGGLAALVAVTASATAALLRYGVAQADARRSELLRLEGLTSLRTWYGLAAGSATELQAAIDRVNDATGVGRGPLEQYTAQLHRMGLRGENLTQALEGMAIVGAVQGDRWARRFAGMAAGAARTGRSVRALADDVRARLGGIAARRMLSLDVQAQRLRDSFQRLFGDLRIEGFLGALNEMTRMFSQSTATGRALKAIVEALFNPLLDAIGGAAPLVRRFFQGMVIGALQLTIVILRLALWLRRTFGDSEILRGIRGLDAGLVALGIGAGVFFVIAGLGAVVIGALAATFGVLVGTTVAAVAAFFWIRDAIASVIARVQQLVEQIRATDFSALGRALADGIVRGLQSGANRVTQAVRGLAAQARGALESALGIASPSRVFAELGVQIPAGLAQGVERGAGAAQDAIDGMVGPPALAAGGTTTHVSIEGGIHVHAQSGDQARQIAESIREQLAEVLEGLGVSIGAEVPS